MARATFALERVSCVLPSGRHVEQPVTGSTDWTSQQTPFRLEAGQNPENLRLNLVIDGSGVVWIDDLEVRAAS